MKKKWLNTYFQNPYPFYDELRSIHPLYRTTILKYSGLFVTGYEEAKMILKDTRFQNRIPLPETSKKYESLKHIQSGMMLFKNGVDHVRIRMSVSKAFTPQALEAYRPYITEVVNNLLDAAQTKKKIEVISEFAFPLASLVIAHLLGVPEEDRDQFRSWSAHLIQTIDFTRSSTVLQTGNDTVLTLMNYFRSLILHKETHLQDDLISMLIKEGKLTDEELLATCILLIIAGHETTVNLISNSLFSLLNHPEQLAELTGDLSMMNKAIEEFLRYESPTQMTARIASEDMEINEQMIRKGEHVYVLLGAANRDPKQFIDANVLNVKRNPNSHLSFGFGSHFCLGSSLARLEAEIAIRTFLERIPQFELAHAHVQWRKLIGFRTLEELQLVFN